MIRNERYILLLESEVQLEKIKSPSIAYAYVLEKNGSCRLCSQG